MHAATTLWPRCSLAARWNLRHPISKRAFGRRFSRTIFGEDVKARITLTVGTPVGVCVEKAIQAKGLQVHHHHHHHHHHSGCVLVCL
jgi:hypothetical protein